MRAFVIISVALVPLLFACSNSIQRSYSFPELASTAEEIAAETPNRGISIYIDQFVDDRAVRDIVLASDGNAASIGDAGRPVAEALVRAFMQRGIGSSDSAPLILSGTVKEWYARVSSGIGGGIAAEARISVTLSDPAGTQLYIALYSGSAEYSGGFSKSEFDRVMAAAMQEAIGQVTSDQKLLGLIESY